ncbi:MAG: GntR family transcriptional regulator [Clostridium sp.]|uniref:GntR family transcriptional regulator n=1 Tax=Clostridium sp. TaxID=1506 RepID=UPI002FCC80F8
MDFNKNMPIYIQIIDYLKFKIASGEIQPSSKFKSVRELAQEMNVNPNTMQRAFAELERDGLVFSNRTSGRYVCDDKEKIDSMRDSLASKEIEALVTTLKSLGYTYEDMINLIESNIKGMK